MNHLAEHLPIPRKVQAVANMSEAGAIARVVPTEPHAAVAVSVVVVNEALVASERVKSPANIGSVTRQLVRVVERSESLGALQETTQWLHVSLWVLLQLVDEILFRVVKAVIEAIVKLVEVVKIGEAVVEEVVGDNAKEAYDPTIVAKGERIVDERGEAKTELEDYRAIVRSEPDDERRNLKERKSACFQYKKENYEKREDSVLVKRRDIISHATRTEEEFGHGQAEESHFRAFIRTFITLCSFRPCVSVLIPFTTLLQFTALHTFVPSEATQSHQHI